MAAPKGLVTQPLWLMIKNMPHSGEVGILVAFLLILLFVAYIASIHFGACLEIFLDAHKRFLPLKGFILGLTTSLLEVLSQAVTTFVMKADEIGFKLTDMKLYMMWSNIINKCYAYNIVIMIHHWRTWRFNRSQRGKDSPISLGYSISLNRRETCIYIFPFFLSGVLALAEAILKKHHVVLAALGTCFGFVMAANLYYYFGGGISKEGDENDIPLETVTPSGPGNQSPQPPTLSSDSSARVVVDDDDDDTKLIKPLKKTTTGSEFNPHGLLQPPKQRVKTDLTQQQADIESASSSPCASNPPELTSKDDSPPRRLSVLLLGTYDFSNRPLKTRMVCVGFIMLVCLLLLVAWSFFSPAVTEVFSYVTKLNSAVSQVLNAFPASLPDITVAMQSMIAGIITRKLHNAIKNKTDTAETLDELKDSKASAVIALMSGLGINYFLAGSVWYLIAHCRFGEWSLEIESQKFINMNYCYAAISCAVTLIFALSCRQQFWKNLLFVLFTPFYAMYQIATHILSLLSRLFRLIISDKQSPQREAKPQWKITRFLRSCAESRDDGKCEIGHITNLLILIVNIFHLVFVVLTIMGKI